MYDRILRFPRLLKTSIALMQIAFLWLSWRIFSGQLDSYVASTALVVSGFWLGLTALRLRSLLRTYFDHFSRLQVMVPTICGIMLAALAIFANLHVGFTAVAVLELIGWTAVFIDYRRNRSNYKKQGHGPLPKDAWVLPPAAALQAGDLILTNGQMAGRVGDSLGHSEVVIMGHNGRLHTLSSYMEHGAVVHSLEKDVADLHNGKDHFIVMRPVTPLTKEQLARMPELAKHFLDLNVAWRKKTNARRQNIINHLPLPKRVKSWLITKTHATGYDWVGLLIGTSAPNRWTCIGLCVQFLKTLGVPVATYGTGILGLGTGLFDPIQPVRLLGDKAFRLVTLDDKARFEAAAKS